MDYPVVLRGGVIVKNSTEHIASYTPYGVDRHAWNTTVGPFVRNAVERTGLTTPGTTVHSLRAVALLADWARQNGIPLKTERVFAIETIERFVATGLHVTEGSKATYRASIRRVAVSNTKNQPWQPRPAKLTRARHTDPYTTEQVSRWWEIATTQKTKERIRAATTVVALGLGVAINASEHLALTGRCVRWDNGVLLVDIPGSRARTVACEHTWADRVAAIAEQFPNVPLIGNVADARNKNRIGSILHGLEIPYGMPSLHPARLRSTWIINQLNRGVRMDEMRDALGWQIGHHLHDYFRFLTPRDEQTRHRALAGVTAHA